ncbi:unnamed protein product [Urochloa humidicola]
MGQGFVLIGAAYYPQAWCVKMKDPVFLAVWTPLCFVFTMFCCSFFLGEIVHLGSVVGGVLLVGGFYSVLWGKSKENKIDDGAREDEQVQHKKHTAEDKEGQDHEMDAKQPTEPSSVLPAEQV